MNNNWKQRLDKIIYGLIYPAFFGNMIYDVINISLGNVSLTYLDISNSLALAGLVIAFVLIDYMHLNGDVNSIYDRPEYKSGYYLFCDLFTPLVLFIAFVFLKTQELFNVGILCFSIVPGIIWVYKRNNPYSKTYFSWYAAISLIIGILIFVLPQFQTALYTELFITLSIFAYGYYMIWHYPKNSREFDLDYVRELMKIYK